MKKTTLLFASIVFVSVLFATNHNVTTVGNTFSPSNITINQGDTVTWTNGGGSHNVNATLSTYPNNPEGFGNSVSSTSWTLQHIFSIPGTYDYQCDPHTGMGMVGTVVVQSNTPNALTLTGIMDFSVPTGGSDGKAIQLTANQNISDLSIYSLNTFSNGSTSGGTPYTFTSISINAGEHVLLCRDSTALAAYFGSCWNTFHHIVQGSQPTGNGDDATALYSKNSGNIVETHGVVGVDGTGQPWEYLDTWAWKDTAVSNVGNWVYGAVNCTDGSSSNATSNCPYPLCNVSPPSSYNVTLFWKL